MITKSDVVIVGARCAGASLAVLLARAGAAVILVERDALHTDQVLSTHTLHPPALDVLDEIGVGDAVRAVAPASRRLRLAKNASSVDLRLQGERAEYCPRRQRLDGLLQDAAAAAGVEVLPRVRVVGLLREGERVSGVRAVDAAGHERDIHARMVIGADGRYSTVARLVGAEEYLGYDAPRAMYWAYWNAVPAWREYPFDMYVGNTRGQIHVIFQTDHGQLLIGSLPPVTQVASWRHDPAAALRADLESNPVTAPLVAGQQPDGAVRGTVKERYFFRQAAGPGWALVGDAGHHKEFVIGDGITEALIQVRSLAGAIKQGTDAALLRWWRERDVEAMPYFFFGKDEGALGGPLKIQEVVFDRVQRSDALRRRMALVMEHQVSPLDVFPVPRILQWTIGAALQGSPSVLRDFMTMARRGAMVSREMKARRALLERPRQNEERRAKN